eukprot:514779_1
MVIEVREICRRRGDQWKTKEDHKDNHNIHHHRTSHHCQLHFYQEPVSLAVLSRVILNPIMWELIRDSQSGLTSREFQNANQAARLGHLSLLQHMDAVNNVHFSSTSLSLAAAGGSIQVVKWLHEVKKVPILVDALDLAAEGGHLPLVQFLTLLKAKCTIDAVDRASAQGHAHVVRWLLENRPEGCSHKAFDAAALHGYRNVLDVLLEHRAPFSVASYEGAASAGHIDVVQWLRDNNIQPPTAEEGVIDPTKGPRIALVAAARARHLNIVKFCTEICLLGGCNNHSGGGGSLACTIKRALFAARGNQAIVNWLSTLPLQIQDQDPVLLRQLRRAHARNTAY